MMTTNDSGGLMAAPRRTIKNASDPRGQLGAYLRHWIDTHHGGDASRLAKSLGVSVRAVQKWCEGSNSPAMADLGRVAEAMGFANWGKLATAACRHAESRQL